MEMEAKHSAVKTAQEWAVTKDGDKVEIKIVFFPAMAGYRLKARYLKWVDDANSEPDFLVDILSYAYVVLSEEDQEETGINEVRLDSEDKINYYLNDWQTMERILELVFSHNGISREPEEIKEYEKNSYILTSGMVKVILMELKDYIKPALQLLKVEEGSK
ncbi:hypothetical protein [Pantoea sp. A4]|uniref:hypothetical protein n=1 Tax=Pantoea sp. A4 TaxID=1225184 RepID=UPI00037FF880|nr:hypothetical protein [Pantoea sp. A4]